MYKDPLLQQAFRLYRKKKYQAVINLLETRIYNFRDSKIFYDVLGVSCLFEQEYAAALSYFTRALELEEDNADTMYCIGLVHYLRGRIRDSLGHLLQALTYDEKHSLSKRLLNHIRKDKSMRREHESYIKESLIPRFVPMNQMGFIISLGVIATLSITAVALVLWYPKKTDIQHEGFALPRGNLTIATRRTQGSASQTNVFVKQGNEVRAAFKEMESLFLENRDIEVRLIANELLLSNISPEVRAKTEHILGLLESKPNFFDEIPEISFASVAADPLLYKAVVVSWRGKIANLFATDDMITFDFLVGYVDQRVLEGIVRVAVDFPIVLENEDSIELLGVIVNEDSGFSIDALSIRTSIE